MAMTRCFTCLHEVDDEKMTKCPNCGAEIKQSYVYEPKEEEPIKKKKFNDTTKVVLNVVIKITLWVIVMIIYRVVIMKGELFCKDNFYVDISVGILIAIILYVIPFFKTDAYYSTDSSNKSDEFREFLDDTMIYQNGTPAERALYNQIKRNNKRK